MARNVGAAYFLPSEDEWYKAAFYDPWDPGADGSQAGDPATIDYWLYATLSDIDPMTAVALGAVGPTVIRARATEMFLAGRPFTEQTMREAGATVIDEISPTSDVRGSEDFRRQLARNVFVKFYHEVSEQIRNPNIEIRNKFESRNWK